MYDKCYFCLDQLPKLKKESTASFFVNFGGAGVQKSRPTLLYNYIRFSVFLFVSERVNTEPMMIIYDAMTNINIMCIITQFIIVLQHTNIPDHHH